MENNTVSPANYIKSLQEAVQNNAINNAKLVALIYDLQGQVSKLQKQLDEEKAEKDGEESGGAEKVTQ